MLKIVTWKHEIFSERFSVVTGNCKEKKKEKRKTEENCQNFSVRRKKEKKIVNYFLIPSILVLRDEL